MQNRRKKISPTKNSTQTVFTRFMLIIAFFILWIGGIGVRLVHLQVNQHEWLAEQAQDQRRNQIKSKQLRGTIYDRSEHVLAMSVQAKSLFADPAEIADVETTANRVAAALKLKPNDVFNQLTEAKEKGKRFVYLARKLDEDAAEKINNALKDTDLRKFDEPRFAGLHWREEQKRSYPYKTLAAQVVGFSNTEDVGSAGIEQSQEELLHGAAINKWQDRDRLGRVYDETTEEEKQQREPPKDVVLTISNSIQYKTEQALEEGVKAARAKSGMAIVLDPKTGEILAMANYPTFDPNNYADFPAKNFKNKSVQNSYAPGSVFKLVTYGAALQEKLIKPDEWFSCGNGSITAGKHEFKDPHCGKAISYTKALAISSNLGAIKTGLKIGEYKFSNYIRQFGFGAETGIELPGETSGLVRPLESWKDDSLASMSIGYEIGITALQMTQAFAAIANDGVRVRPHVVKEIRQADGKVISAEPEKTTVVSPEAAGKLRNMLREVVLSGTGKEAALQGYTSAGKTGTAWKYDPRIKRVSGSKYTSSFVGFAPVDNPAVVIAVVMDEPQGALRNGGQVSAPVFRRIAEQILPELNVAPDDLPIPESLTAQTMDVPTEMETAAPDTPVNSGSKTALIKIAGSKPIEEADKKSADNKERKTEKIPQEKIPQKERGLLNKPPREIKAETNKALTEEKAPANPKPTTVKEKPKIDTKNKSSGDRTRIVN